MISFRRRIAFAFSILFSINIAYSQTKIVGKVVESETASGVTSSVTLKDEAGNIVAYTNSKITGNYSLSTTVIGKFTLNVSALSFEKKSVEITIDSGSVEIQQNFTLNPKIIELKEVIISQTQPIKIKNDTITFDAKSFLQGNEQVVEDLLKKIPGLNVLSDGTVKIGNQEVEKIMIDGDDFFERGYKIISKNMPVGPIDKIELYQHYSNNKLLKGIENSEKVALNLTLQEDAKRVWFGNIYGGYGTQNRYEARGNLMNFGKTVKHYFPMNINNIGMDATGDINHLIRPFRFGEPASIGDNQSANSLLSLNYELPNLNKKRVNLNNAKMLSLNSIYTLSEKIKLKTLFFVNSDQNNFIRNSFQSFAVGTTNFTNTEDFDGRKNQFTGFGKLDLNYDISKIRTFEYVGKFNKTNERNRSDLVFNGNPLNEQLNNNNQLFDQKIVLTNKIKENKVMLLSGRYINEKTPQTYSVNQFIFEDLFPENADNVKQLSQNQMQFAGFEGHLMDRKKNGDLLEIKVGNQLRVDKLDTEFQLFNNELNLSLPTNYQNSLTYSTNDSYISGSYRFKFGNYTLVTQSDFHQLFNQIRDSELKSTQNRFFVVPKVGLDWKINQKNKLITAYLFNTTNAGVLDVYSGFVQTGFRSFDKGLDDFNQLTASSATLNYTYGSWGDKLFANSYILYSKNNDFFSTNSILAPNYSQNEKIIIKDRELLNFTSNIDRFFESLKSNLKVTLSGTKTNFKNIVNNSDLREIKNLNVDYGFEVRSGFTGVFNYNFGSKWTYNQVNTATMTNSFTNNMSFVDFSFVFSEKFNFQVQSERYFFGNLEEGSNKYYFLDLEARYVVKPNKLTLFISGNNLLNTDTFRNYAISDISISTAEFRIQPRYILLKTELRF